MGEILIKQRDGSWRAPGDKGYALESELQHVLAEHPALIPGVGPDAVACREFQTEGGPADVVVLDVNGELTIVECKLASNPQIRREIVGQLFDYASCFWKMDIVDFIDSWNKRADNVEALDRLTQFESWRSRLALNLDEGRFRLVLAVDRINPPLKRIIEYLNRMSGADTSVIAVAYARLAQGDLELLMPQVYGQEIAEAKQHEAAKSRTLWDFDTYRSWAQTNDPATVPNFEFLVKEAKARGMNFLGSQATLPSGGFPVLSPDGRQLGRLSVYYYSGMGTSLELDFTRIPRIPEVHRPTDKELASFLQQIETIPEFRQNAEVMRVSNFSSRKPNVPLPHVTRESLTNLLNALTTFGKRP